MLFAPTFPQMFGKNFQFFLRLFSLCCHKSWVFFHQQLSQLQTALQMHSHGVIRAPISFGDRLDIPLPNVMKPKPFATQRFTSAKQTHGVFKIMLHSGCYCFISRRDNFPLLALRQWFELCAFFVTEIVAKLSAQDCVAPGPKLPVFRTAKLLIL